MEEIEVPTEHLHEAIHEKAEGQGEPKESWSMYLAISTALMAVLAALASLLAGHHSNEALIEQIKSSDSWSHYQAKSIKYEIYSLKHDLIAAKGEDDEKAKSKMEGYKKDQEEIKAEAESAGKKSESHLARHVILARSVTIFQISIAISAIAMLTKRKFLWYGSMVLSVLGIVFFVMGIL
jgi:hypothetical protein